MYLVYWFVVEVQVSDMIKAKPSKPDSGYWKKKQKKPCCHYRFSVMHLPTAFSSVAETQESLATTRTIRVVGNDSCDPDSNKMNRK
jgi:hypothetical protein